MTIQINPEKLAAFDAITLDHGSHTNFDDGHCAMEVVAVTDLWDSYPEIGEHDWAAIVARVHALGTAVADGTSGGYADAAYEFLTARATTDG